MAGYSKVRVSVTEEHCEQGTQRDSSHCTVAMAVQDAVPDARFIHVDLQTIRFSIRDLGKRFTYLTPRAAQIAIIDFDHGQRPEPFDMVLKDPQVSRMDLSRQDGTRPTRPMSPARKAAMEKARRTQQQVPKTRTITKPRGDRSARVNGGRTPPTTPFARRRAFGLRALER